MRGVVVLAVSCLGAGCSHLGYYAAHPVPVPPESVTPGGTAVLIRDARPGWERKPFRGPPALLAFQHVTPSPWDALRREAERAIAVAAVKPTRVEVATTAYRVVIREPDPPTPLQNEAARSADGEPPSFLATVIGVFVDGLVEAMTGPPAEVRAAPDGASCRLEADVRVTWPGGQVTSVRIDARGASAAKCPTSGWRGGVDRSVRQAASEFGTSLQHHISAGPPARPGDHP